MIIDTRVHLLEAAEKLRSLLNSGGTQTLTQLKKRLKARSEVVNFAVGWLAREGRIEIRPEKRDFRLQLK
jgi:hypothetical protein